MVLTLLKQGLQIEEAMSKEEKKGKGKKGTFRKQPRPLDDWRSSTPVGIKKKDHDGNEEASAKTSTPDSSIAAEDIKEVPPTNALPPLFGESLSEALKRTKETNPSLLVPDVLYEATKYLTENGELTCVWL